MEFPVFRKYSNNRSYFKIVSPEEFIELKQEPSGFKKYNFEVKILPDRVLVQDLISFEYEHILESTSVEFDSIQAKIIA